MPPRATTKYPRPSAEDAAALRQERLRLTVLVASWWLVAQGALFLFLGDWTAIHWHLRYDNGMRPYLRMLALTLLCLGFFLLKSLRDPRRQYLAIDVLILYFLGQVYFLLSYKLGYYSLSPLEWFSGGLDLALGSALVLFRTRSTQMQGAGTLLSGKALDFARETKDWVQRKGPPPTVTLGELESKGDEPISEAIPHLD